MNYFQASPGTPYHISVGAIVVTETNEVLCHHYDTLRGIEDVYIMMRKTLQEGESLERALVRGLQVEFGAKASLISYLGSIVASDPWFGEKGTPVIVEKTTLYFLMRLVSIDENTRDKGHPEYGSHIEYKSFEFLTEVMKRQKDLLHVQDIDESGILERAQLYFKMNRIYESTKI